jgi:Tol biopolymer transport system component
MLNANTRNCFYLCLFLLLGMISGSALATGQTTWVSAAGFGDNYSPSLSANGRYVAFWSQHLGHLSDSPGIFIYDRLTKQTALVIQVATELGVTGSALGSPSLSADGRYVVFWSTASDLVAGDTNGKEDVFVRDRLTNQTTRASVSTAGEQGNNSSSGFPSISADGRYVAFTSIASNLVVRDSNNSGDVFLHDRLTKQTTRISVATGGIQGNSASFGPSLSANGRYVAFESLASNLVAGDTNGVADAFLHDRLTKQTARVSVATGGAQEGNGSSHSSGLSASGRYVAFGSLANNLVAGDTNGVADAFVHDLLTKQTTRVSVRLNGVEGNGDSFPSNLSADGRYVAFLSYASNLVGGGDTNNSGDAFVHDRLTKQTTRVSVATDGTQANGFSPGISADGRYVAFESTALRPNNTGSFPPVEVFVRDRTYFPQKLTDLKITAATKPTTLAVNDLGSYTYTLANVGLFPVFPQVTHLVSNGFVTAFANSQNICQRAFNTGPCGCHRYATISLCNLDVLQPGTSMTLTLTVKAVRNVLHQQLTLSSYGRDDPVKANNYLSLDTPVTP